MRNAAITASLVLHIANRDAMMPRFTGAAMPPLPAGRGSTAPAAPPIAENRIFVAAKNKPLTTIAPGLARLAAPVTTDAGTPSAAIDTNPAHGTVTLRPDGSFVYTPAKDFTGTDTFSFKLTLGATTTAPGTVTVIVQ